MKKLLDLFSGFRFFLIFNGSVFLTIYIVDIPDFAPILAREFGIFGIKIDAIDSNYVYLYKREILYKEYIISCYLFLYIFFFYIVLFSFCSIIDLADNSNEFIYTKWSNNTNYIVNYRNTLERKTKKMER